MPRWLPIEGRLTFPLSSSNIRVASPLASQLFAGRTWCAKWKSQQPTLTHRTQHVRNCAESNTNMKGVDQDAEGPCVEKPQVQI
jgi:hypothetical protein